jgi:predicted TIM-barrel fold metal-dependent hydrolase
MTRSIEIHGVRQSAPTSLLPPGATDCHTHVFGPASRFPYAEDRVYTPPDASIEDLRRLHAHLGITRVVIVQPSPYGTDNRATVDAVAALGRRARAVAVIPATLRDEQTEALEVQGVRGVRLNLATLGVSDPKTAWIAISALAPKLADQGWHLQIFANITMIEALAAQLATLPVTLVFDHFGGLQASKGAGQRGVRVLAGLLETGQAYVKLSASYRVASAEDQDGVAALAETLIKANPERIVWGTDWPHPGHRKPGMSAVDVQAFQPIDNGIAVDRLVGWAGSRERLERILVSNPARLYGF